MNCCGGATANRLQACSHLVLRTVDVERLIEEDLSAAPIWQLVRRLDLSLEPMRIAHAFTGSRANTWSVKASGFRNTLSENGPTSSVTPQPLGRFGAVGSRFSKTLVWCYSFVDMSNRLTSCYAREASDVIQRH